jgi:cell division transport system permease protein
MPRKPMARPKSRRPETRPAPRTGARARPAAKKGRSTGAFHRPGPGRFFARHARMFVGSIGRLVRHPLATLMTVAVIGIALALPAALQLFVANGRSLSGQWDDAIEVSIYLERSVTAEQARALAETLENDPAVAEVAVITAEEALAEFRAHSGFGEALEALPDNPLPSLLVALPAPDRNSADDIAALAERLAAELPADTVQVDTEWVGRFHAMLEIIRRVVALAAGLLALGVVIIVGNTIRLDIQNRRDEIEVAKLIGATDGFIRAPFLYTGFWYGLLGGLLAFGLVVLALLALEGPVRRLAGLYASGFALTGPGLAGAAALGFGGAALGWLGSWISATRNMRRIEPGH